MDPRASFLIKQLNLQRHPEGGFYSEIFRSECAVLPEGERSERSALTTIYFLLTAGQASLFHRVASDEVWHHLEGDSLDLFVIDPQMKEGSRLTLESTTTALDPALAVRIVKAGSWQAARSNGSFSLLGCTVGPGFDFADFDLARSLPDEAKQISTSFPDWADLI